MLFDLSSVYFNLVLNLSISSLLISPRPFYIFSRASLRSPVSTWRVFCSSWALFILSDKSVKRASYLPLVLDRTLPSSSIYTLTFSETTVIWRESLSISSARYLSWAFLTDFSVITDVLTCASRSLSCFTRTSESYAGPPEPSCFV